MSDSPARAEIRFLFNVCNDVEAMRHFYVDVLGMEQAAFMNDEELGWLAIQCEGFQMMWTRGEGGAPVATEFSQQPGWPGGTRPATSWGVHVPEDRFADVCAKLRESGAALLQPVPQWRQDCYWGLSVLDPMGATVEVYNNPAEASTDTVWPAA